MPLPSNLTSKRAFNQRYVEPYKPEEVFNLVKTALRDLSDDPYYEPLSYDDVYDDLDDNEKDDRKIHSAFNTAIKNDKVISKYVSEFSTKSVNEPYFTDSESYDEFLKTLYNHLCKKIWEKLQKKYPDSPDFKEPFESLEGEHVNVEDEEVTEIMSAITGLIESGRLTLPENVSKETIKETICTLKKCVDNEPKIFKSEPAETRFNRFSNNRSNFRDNMCFLDKILAPHLVNGDNATFDNAYYWPMTDHRYRISYFLDERLNAIREFSKSDPEKGSVERMMRQRFELPDSIVKFRDKALSKLIECREELDASDHFFQNSSQQFKDMKKALDDAIKSIRSVRNGSYEKVDAEAIRKRIDDQLKNVSEKTTDYLIYKEDGPTGFFGASRVAAAKGLRNALRSLQPAINRSEIIRDCEKNIKDIFGEPKAVNPGNQDFNLSEASRKIAGYIAPCSGTNMERYKAFYMFDEDFEKDYAFAKSSRIDLVLDYIKHPDEANALKNRVEVTKNNYKPVFNAGENAFITPKNDLRYRYVGASYAVKGLIDKFTSKKSPDTDTVLLGELTKVLNEDIKAIKDVKIDQGIKNKIKENTKYANALIVTAEFLKKAITLDEKAKQIASLDKPEEREKYTAQQWNELKSTPVTEEDLETMVAYSLLKRAASGKGGMSSVLDIAFTGLANNPNWTWDKMARDLSKDSKIPKIFATYLNAERNPEKEVVNGKTNVKNGPGHIMRHYSEIMRKIKQELDVAIHESVKKTNENGMQAGKNEVNHAEKTEVNPEVNPAAKPSGPAMQ